MLLWLFGNGSGDGHHTLRAALAGMVAFGACLLLGPRVIAWLRAKKVGERVPAHRVMGIGRDQRSEQSLRAGIVFSRGIGLGEIQEEPGLRRAGSERAAVKRLRINPVPASHETARA